MATNGGVGNPALGQPDEGLTEEKVDGQAGGPKRRHRIANRRRWVAEGSGGALTVRLGTHVVPVDGALETGNRMGAGSYANGKVQVSEVSGQPAEYRGSAAAHNDSTQIYSGWVVKATPSGSEISLQLDNGLVLEESLAGGAQLRSMPAPEAIWSVAQWGGLKPEQLHVYGLTALPDQVLVVVPVDGLVLKGELKLGPVTLTSDPSLAAAGLAPLTDSPRKEAFAAAGTWAAVVVEADFLYNAELGALPRIHAAIDRLALEAQYSLACDPDGTAIPFDRTWLLTNPTPRQDVLVVGMKTPRRYLRSLVNLPVLADLSIRRVRLPPMPRDPDATFEEAVRAWRRAVRSSDRVEAVGAIFEAVEFFVRGVTVQPIFGAGDLDLIRAAVAVVDLTADQHGRLADVIARANESPLLIKIRESLAVDAVPHSQAEIDALWRLRKCRNKAQHGKARHVPDDSDLDLAKGIVNRMLCFRAWHTRNP
jgi:hypothetical protein